MNLQIGWSIANVLAVWNISCTHSTLCENDVVLIKATWDNSASPVGQVSAIPLLSVALSCLAYRAIAMVILTFVIPKPADVFVSITLPERTANFALEVITEMLLQVDITVFHRSFNE